VVEALEAALAVYPGKALINSVTGEDERLERILPLVKKYDAAVIGMANDETGISNDPEVRLAVAQKIVERARDYSIPIENIIIDPLCLTVSADTEAAKNTLRAMELIRRELGVNMSLGASNVSFGIPDRAPVNAAFLAMGMWCGLTCSITDPTNPVIRQAILAGDLLMGNDPYASTWIAQYRERQKAMPKT
jgi:5-methyltetrahydrofolate--homocysteine methyltransferase